MSATQEQLDAVNHPSGCQLIIAGAGAGKTHVMTEKTAYLVNNRGVPGYRIITIMFGRDATNGYLKRLKKRLPEIENPKVYTFHQASTEEIIPRLIKVGALERADFKFNGNARIPLLKQVIAQKTNDHKLLWGTVFKAIQYIDLKKATLLPHAELCKKFNISEKAIPLDWVFAEYEKLRKQMALRFNEDLIYDPVFAVQQRPELKAQLEGHFQAILLDEFQDICASQFELVKLLATPTTDVIAVGDDDQTIFTWRGADPRFMSTEFKMIFPDTTTFHLSQTFRYGSQVSLAAYHVISNNTSRIPKISVSNPHAPNTQIVIDAETGTNATFIRHIKEWLASGRKLAESAVLVRAYSHAASIEISLLQHGINYQMAGGVSFFALPEMQPILCGLQLLSGNYSALDKQTKVGLAIGYLNFPAITLSSDQSSQALYKEIRDRVFTDPDGISEYIAEAAYRITSPSLKNKYLDKSNNWKMLSMKRDISPLEAIELIMTQLNLEEEVMFATNNDQDMMDEWAERIEALKSYSQLVGMDLQTFAKLIIDLYINAINISKSTDYITILSVHKSKGLEYPFVVMPKLIEGKFPLIRKNQPATLEHIEDERRLFFVAMTRAQEKLLLIPPKDDLLAATLGAGMDNIESISELGAISASRFLYESNAFLCQGINDVIDGDTSILEAAKSKNKTIDFLRAMSNLGLLKL